mmetsp:Transcript_72833/g.137773  ORF Transcript_72833/g.137773 Transcript_72833/m.137773 type:complete len:99 (+) Transcript_72833:83-379(+)
MCPLRFIALILAACGLAWVMGPMAMGAAGVKSKSVDERRGKGFCKRLAAWLVTIVIFALHCDLLLSLGYTRCAFQSVRNIHMLWRSGTFTCHGGVHAG